jgi:hypothetical protein
MTPPATTSKPRERANAPQPNVPKFPPELVEAMATCNALPERVRQFNALAKTKASERAAAMNARDRLTDEVRERSAVIALEEAARAVDAAMGEAGAQDNLSKLKRKLEAVQTELRKAESTIATCDAVLAGIPKKLEQLEQQILDAAAVLRPLAKAFRDRVLEALSAEYLAAFRAFERLFPRLAAYADALRLGSLRVALRGVDIPNPIGTGKFVFQGSLWEGSKPTTSLLSWQGDLELVGHVTELSGLAALEDRLSGYYEVIRKRKADELAAKNHAARDRAFAVGRPSAISAGQIKPPPPAPAPEPTPAARPQSWTTTWEEPPSPGYGPMPAPPAAPPTDGPSEGHQP